MSRFATHSRRRTHAHSVECWADGELVGGLYGVSLKAAFFGESMFSRRTDASKVALVHLVARLIVGGYRLLDAQFITDHLTQFGAEEIALVGLEVESPDPAGLAAHWAKIIEVPVGKNAAGEPTLSFVNNSFRFIKGPKEVLGSLVFGVQATDMLTLCTVSLMLTAVGLLASVIPAWRATRVSPLAALRDE